MRLFARLSGNVRIYIQPQVYRFNTLFDGCSFLIEIEKIEQNITIQVLSSDSNHFRPYYLLFSEWRKFEMLFIGGFYTVEEMFFCNEHNKSKKIHLNHELPFYNLKPINYNYELHHPLTNDFYCRYFNEWLTLNDELGIVHQMFLYSISDTHMPVDISMALLSQTYQPLYGYLVMNKKIDSVVSAKSYTCQNCGAIKAYKNEPTFNECLTAIFNTYGQHIFHSEWSSINKLIDKIVKTRNKIVHVDATTKNILSGVQNAVYKRKLTLMYRHIVLDLIGIDNRKSVAVVAKHIDATFPQGLCL